MFRRLARCLAPAAVIAASSWGCSSYATHVATEDGALGKVVVYRNGIAYFERRAEPSGQQITLRVPQDKVDDFLKSLTVRDAASGKTYPVSFPTQAAAQDGNVDMVVQLPADVSGEVILSYITDAPSWKPSYRLVVQDDGKVAVQGWAIVDNTSGEDWSAVRLGVGSSSALSFRYDLRTIRLVHRETLHDQQLFAVAPPGGDVAQPIAGGQRVLAELTDLDIPRNVDHPDVAALESESWARPSAGAAADGAMPSAPPAPAQIQLAQRRKDGNKESVKRLADQLKQASEKVVIEGYADAGERDAVARSLDRANLLRNQLIEEGVAPALLEVRGNGVVDGRRAGAALVADKSEGASGGAPELASKPIGESHFESHSTMTVPRGTSAMVSILDDNAKGDIVYLYDSDSPRGNARFAFKAVRFTNPTRSTLESGPVTVYGDGRFIGEGLSEPIPPGTTAFVPFALDRQISVDRTAGTGDRIARLVTLQRGVLTAEMQHTRKTQYTVTNRSVTPGRVYVKHAVPRGWDLTGGPKPVERLGDSDVFAVDLAGGEAQTITIEEATPITRTVDLRAPSSIELVRVYLEAGSADARFKDQMKGLLELHNGIANTEAAIGTTREQMDDYRVRIDELEGQLANLKRLKTDGKLMRHLQDKMVEVSERLQGATLRVVELQQELMLKRIQFQDGVAELTLEHGVAAK